MWLLHRSSRGCLLKCLRHNCKRWQSSWKAVFHEAIEEMVFLCQGSRSYLLLQGGRCGKIVDHCFSILPEGTAYRGLAEAVAEPSWSEGSS